MSKEVPLKDAEYIVFIDFCDACMSGFATYEDALDEVEQRKTDGGFSGTWEHFIVKKIDIITIEHGDDSDD